MNTTQFNTYAAFYDLLYKDKNYAKEAAYIHQLISRINTTKTENLSVLDLACGTGKHLFELHDLGYKNLTGSDIASAMIKVAKEQASETKKDIEFYNYSFQDADHIDKKFQVVISMFSAVNYLTSFADQFKTFRNVHSLLEDNGLFIFDYWNGNAVVRDYSPVKVLNKKDGDSEIMRVSTTTIDTITQSVAVKFNCTYFEGNQRLDEFEEVHHLHYYHFSEMYNLLETTGFEILHVSPFMHPDETITSHDWNVSIVSRKKN